MPALPVRRIATSALCAALILGAVAPAIASDRGPDRAGSAEAPRSTPTPGTEQLLSQIKSLQNATAVLAPVTTFLNTVLKSPDSKAIPEDAEKLTESIQTAIEAAEASAGTTPATVTPTSPAASTTPATVTPTSPAASNAPATVTPASPAASTTPAAVAPPLAPAAGTPKSLIRHEGQAPLDSRSEALTALQTAINRLTTAVTKGDTDNVNKQVPLVVSGLVDLLAATLINGGLPSPGLSGLTPPPAGSTQQAHTLPAPE